MGRDITGTVYLIHFDTPYIAQSGKGEKTCQHYIGWASDLDSRIADHRSGSGARLLAVINAAGIGWSVARTWKGTRKDERRLKNRKASRCLCPLCNPRAEKNAKKF